MAERILIVDDDPNALRLIGYALQRQGYKVIVAQDGQKALIHMLVVNRVRTAVALTRTEVEEILDRELLALITPAPELFRQGTREGQPAILVQPEGLHANLFRQLADTLM